MASLLPAAIDEFRRKEYWERFFTLRGPKAFEWYGEWADVAPTLHPLLAPDAAVLVVGCGNSELGSHVHDSGVGRVVSIDFAESVIRDMRERNRARRGMEFLVMDALHMDFAPASFDIVIDKATLDALMTQEGSAEVVEQAHAMLSEVARVLRDGGRYVCITLAQEHILRTLLHAFCAAHPGWRTTVRMLPSSVQTELCAFQIDFVKPACGAVRALGAAHAQPLTGGEACVTFPEGASLGAAALGAAALGTRTGTAERAVDAAGALERVQELQRQFVTARRIARVARGVRAHLDLWSAAAEGSDGAGPGPRFSLTVVDAATRGSDEPASCAVLLVPQGREHEFMFAVEEGQLQLADSAGFDRLVLVTLNRGHAFSDLDAVQAELSPSILPVQPPCCKGPVPFLRVGDDIGSRDTRCVLETSATGEMVVEDVTDADGQLARRLVFMSNRNSIQSEARVVERRVLDKRARGAGKAAQRHQQQQGKGRKNGRGGQPAAVAAAPSAPAVATAAAADVAAAVADGHGPMDLVVDHGYLAFEVHRAMVASMAVAPAFAAGGPSRRHVAVVGLGGGALPMFLAQHFAWMEVTAVELDAAVVEVARQHFAFREGPHLRVRVEDGLQFIRDTGSAVHAGTARRSDVGVPCCDHRSRCRPDTRTARAHAGRGLEGPGGGGGVPAAALPGACHACQHARVPGTRRRAGYQLHVSCRRFARGAAAARGCLLCRGAAHQGAGQRQLGAGLPTCRSHFRRTEDAPLGGHGAAAAVGDARVERGNGAGRSGARCGCRDAPCLAGGGCRSGCRRACRRPGQAQQASERPQVAVHRACECNGE